MTSFIEHEIARARTFAGVVRCRECAGRGSADRPPPARGHPIAGAAVSLYQVASSFDLGAAWTDEPLAALEPFARLGTDLLVPYPPSPALLDACEALALRVTLVLPAPGRAESLPEWRDRCLPEPGALPHSATAVSGWAVDVSARPEAPQHAGPDPVLAGALAELGQLTGKPVALLGLHLPNPSGPGSPPGRRHIWRSSPAGHASRAVPPSGGPPSPKRGGEYEAPATAACYGIRLDAPGTRGHLAELRRALCRATETLGACFVHGLSAPPPDPERLPRSWALGGAERYQAEAMAERVTLCFSVPGVTGVFCNRLVDLPSDSAPACWPATCGRSARTSCCAGCWSTSGGRGRAARRMPRGSSPGAAFRATTS
jgi:hypothetical protein